MISPPQSKKLRALISTRRKERVEALASKMRMREVISYDPCGGFMLLHDFAFRDPASGRWRQYNVTSFSTDRPRGSYLRLVREHDKEMIAREMDRLAGDCVQPISMDLPYGLCVEARMV